MKIFRFILSVIVTVTMIWCLERPWGSIPALGPLFDPVKGFIAAAEPHNDAFHMDINSRDVQAPVEVYFDDRLVPHIFAQNEEDLYFAQGYVTASLRLWQMEMTAFASAGRVSEKLGPAFLEYDRLQRRLGMLSSAENARDAMPADDPTMRAVEAYGRGVNAYIQTLEYKDLPVEYKLMGFQPEEWSTLNTFLLLKYMSNTLTGYDDDAAFSNILNMIGSDDFNILYPERYYDEDPIIPAGTVFQKDTIMRMDSLVAMSSNITKPNNLIRSGNEQSGIGSNNWALSASKTNTGYPILANDPHLPLNLPSLWMEIQLHAPGLNVYGVSLPGSPCVIIGFNEKVAWGVTNAGRDVRDWYRIQKSAESPDSYVYEGAHRPFTIRREPILIKGQETYMDTITSTHHGPMVFNGFSSKYDSWADLAMKWSAHEPSNELRTFYLLNKASNYADYRDAIRTFTCPSQNFVFAAVDGDIAITEAGKFSVKWAGQGRTILDGSKKSHEWGTVIPWNENPYVLNPERGFVSSANQHPTDSTYPYYYTGFDFEHFRNRRINDQLSKLTKAGITDMQRLQQDNFNLIAAESLPAMLSVAQQQALPAAQEWLNKLSEWDYMNIPESSVPTVFQVWWDQYNRLLWDEFNDTSNINLVPPKPQVTISTFDLPETYRYFDNKHTTAVETRSDIILMALDSAVAVLEKMTGSTTDESAWYLFKGTSIMHLAQLAPFSHKNISVGGNKNIVNATSAKNGPSWRMIVALGKKVEAYAIYPGGQSGNPGSVHYDDFIDDWAAGKYYRLQFFLNTEEAKKLSKNTYTFNPI
jgi:penicillin amidase